MLTLCHEIGPLLRKVLLFAAHLFSKKRDTLHVQGRKCIQLKFLLV